MLCYVMLCTTSLHFCIDEDKFKSLSYSAVRTTFIFYYNGELVVNVFDRIFFILAGNDGSHKISEGFDIGLDWTF